MYLLDCPWHCERSWSLFISSCPWDCWLPCRLGFYSFCTHTHAGSCKLCGVDMPSIVNSLIHHSSRRLHIESSSSGFLLDWNKRGHWQQWRSYRGRLGSTAIHQTVWCTFIHWEIRCFFIRLNPTREPFIQF